MTKSQRDFVSRVMLSLQGLDAVSVGACPGCDECNLSDIDTMNCPEFENAGEGFFSWSSCDTCGSTLGGNRYPAHGIAKANQDLFLNQQPDREIIHLDICVDCVFYLSNGDLPDGP